MKIATIRASLVPIEVLWCPFAHSAKSVVLATPVPEMPRDQEDIIFLIPGQNARDDSTERS